MQFTLLPYIIGSILIITSYSSYAAPNGESWEYRNTMHMEGMSMPPMTMKICKEAGWSSPPQGKEDNRCKVKDFEKSGDKMSWEMTCPEGSGRGEMLLQGNDAFTGFTEFTTGDGTMRMDMSGRKLGSCELGNTRPVINGSAIPNIKY